jgi:hypothetical protein
MIDPELLLSGTLHAFIAFDWGEEIRLDEARQLRPARSGELARRPRTPSSISYRPAPLQFPLPPLQIELPELGQATATVEATAFDFGAVSVALHIPFSLPATALSRLAGWLAEPAGLVRAAEASSNGLYDKLLPAIRQPLRADLTEEYFVFQFVPEVLHRSCPALLDEAAPWLAGLLRLEAGELSVPEIAEALRQRLSYSPGDLFLCEWAAAVLVDIDCGETLQIIEFANVQLLEFRHIDRRLDDRLESAYQLIHRLTRSWLPLWHTHGRPLRALGEMKIEANALFERTSSALRLVGDQYLARVYRLLAARFHLDEWEKNIRQSLDVAQGVYQVLSDQATSYRTELLEIIVVALILVEVVLAVFRH